MQSHQDLLDLIKLLSELRDLDLSELHCKIKEHFGLAGSNGAEARKTIELALQVWLTINIRSDRDVRTDAPSLELPMARGVFDIFDIVELLSPRSEN